MLTGICNRRCSRNGKPFILEVNLAELTIMNPRTKKIKRKPTIPFSKIDRSMLSLEQTIYFSVHIEVIAISVLHEVSNLLPRDDLIDRFGKFQEPLVNILR